MRHSRVFPFTHVYGISVVYFDVFRASVLYACLVVFCDVASATFVDSTLTVEAESIPQKCQVHDTRQSLSKRMSVLCFSCTNPT
jgi:hypothetical protein